MRSVIYEYIKRLRLQQYVLTDSLPWDDNGTALYQHNKKHIYVDTDQTTQSSMINTFSSAGTVDEITTVSVYFVNDAKKLPPDYDNIVEQLKGARTAAGTEGYIQKLCQVSSTYDNDTIVTTLEFSFRKLLTN